MGHSWYSWGSFMSFDDALLRSSFLPFLLKVVRSILCEYIHCTRNKLVISWLICSLTTNNSLHGPGGKSALTKLPGESQGLHLSWSCWMTLSVWANTLKKWNSDVLMGGYLRLGGRGKLLSGGSFCILKICFLMIYWVLPMLRPGLRVLFVFIHSIHIVTLWDSTNIYFLQMRKWKDRAILQTCPEPYRWKMVGSNLNSGSLAPESVPLITRYCLPYAGTKRTQRGQPHKAGSPCAR